MQTLISKKGALEHSMHLLATKRLLAIGMLSCFIPLTYSAETGHPGHEASVAQDSNTNHFCIEESMRVIQERRIVTGRGTTVWRKRIFDENGIPISGSQDPGFFPTNGFYSGYIINGQSHFLVRDLARECGFLIGGSGSFVEKVEGAQILTYSTTQMPLVTGIEPTNYLSKFEILNGYLKKLEKVIVGVNLTELEERSVSANRNTHGFCEQAVEQASSRLINVPWGNSETYEYRYDPDRWYLADTHSTYARIPVGKFVFGIHDYEGAGSDASSGHALARRGKLKADLSSFQRGTAEVYLKRTLHNTSRYGQTSAPQDVYTLWPDAGVILGGN